jgi:hypothetical protein
MPKTTISATAALPAAVLLSDVTHAATLIDASATHLRGLFEALQVRAESVTTADDLSRLILACSRVGEEYLGHIESSSANVQDLAARIGRTFGPQA